MLVNKTINNSLIDINKFVNKNDVDIMMQNNWQLENKSMHSKIKIYEYYSSISAWGEKLKEIL